MILRAYSLPVDLSTHSRTTAKFPSPRVLPTLYLSAIEAGTAGYSSSIISSAAEEDRKRQFQWAGCIIFKLRFFWFTAVPSLLGPSPSSIELQTFVEAKEREEPLCWEPWNKGQPRCEEERHTKSRFLTLIINNKQSVLTYGTCLCSDLRNRL